MGFLEAVKEEDVLGWAGLWVETLAQAADYNKEPQLKDFDRKDGFLFVKHDEKSEGGDREKKVEEGSDSVATTALSVIWLGKIARGEISLGV
jgi:hypothetical protein